MVTSLNNTVPARNDGSQDVQYLRRSLVASTDNAGDRVIGTIPAGSIILKPLSGAYVGTAFDAGSVMNIGPSTDPGTDLWATNLALATANTFVPLDEVVAMSVTSDTTIVARLSASGTIVATTAAADVVIAYIPAADR